MSQGIECITPRVIVSDNWGRAHNGQIVDVPMYGYACIAPDSEADSVELRPQTSFKQDWQQRITVSRDSPYIGPIGGKGLGIFPTMEAPVNTGQSEYQHRMKLLLYPSPLPQPPGRGVARINFVVGMTDTVVLPLIPAMGRRHVKFDLHWVREAGDTSDIDIAIAGRQADSPKYGIVSLASGGTFGTYQQRFLTPTNADDYTEDGSEASGWWEPLYTEAAIAASADISMVGTDAFDWYRITVTLNSGAFHGDSVFKALMTLRD